MKQAERRKFHYIYKITRVDGKFYIGMHSTDEVEDGYFGSGQLLWKSIKKHGKEKHSKEILEFLPSRKELKDREREMVNEELLGDKRCMNLKLGGEGGFVDGASAKGNARFKQKLIENPEFKAKHTEHLASVRQISTAALKKAHPSGTWKDKKHSIVTRVTMRASHQGKHDGEKNSQFGTCWMSKDLVTVKVKRTEVQEYLMNGYVLGRK